MYSKKYKLANISVSRKGKDTVFRKCPQEQIIYYEGIIWRPVVKRVEESIIAKRVRSSVS